ncbi:hypothetical protein CEXT_57381 [Caerostris extrusa]|uniref:Uncharacterized protein n=1 Tax=Caerostris extrusa TaxID=172846 RepID=A0AAV4XJ81_CAEEX|nr:hypothetical protein CEXT_57381 [Caerostris extrusa]
MPLVTTHLFQAAIITAKNKRYQIRIPIRQKHPIVPSENDNLLVRLSRYSSGDEKFINGILKNSFVYGNRQLQLRILSKGYRMN